MNLITLKINRMNHFNNNHRKKPFFIFMFIILGLFALGSIIMLLWNALLPDLFSFPEINYWQALGLFLLCRLLLGGFKFGGKHHFGEGRAAWKEKMMNMSEEEKQVFKERWKERCGHGRKKDLL